MTFFPPFFSSAEFLYALIGFLFLAYLVSAYTFFDARTLARSLWRRVRLPWHLARTEVNPILSPHIGSFWESEAVFNPAAILIDGKVHLLYRAIGGDGISRWGYAASEDGVRFSVRLPYPVFSFARTENIGKKFDPVLYPSGGSWGGAEDPRVVVIDNKVYVTFNAFDGWDFVRVALTSISVKDFLSQRFYWNTPQLLSPARQINKNWVLFPEKINGRFALLHSITPEIQIEYTDRLEDIENTKSVTSVHKQKSDRDGWEHQIRSAAAPPIRTNMGWLVLYHAHDEESHRYKLGALLLDLHHPSTVVHRSPGPVLAPDAWYENEWKAGVVYACGAVVKNGELLVYYGGGDRTVNVARANLDQFIRALTQDATPHLESERTKL